MKESVLERISHDQSDIVLSDGGINIDAYYERILKKGRRVSPVEVTTKTLDYGLGEIYPFLRIASPRIGSGDVVVAITANFHSLEISGIFALDRYIDHFFDYAHKRGVKLIIYPSENPLGAELSGEGNPDRLYDLLTRITGTQIGNNDFLRYELKSGEITDDLGNQKDFARWMWASEIPSIKLPPETQVMEHFIRNVDLKTGAKIVAVLDIYQDYWTMADAKKAGAYHFCSEEQHDLYVPIMQTVGTIVPLIANYSFDAGYQEGKIATSDRWGMIVRYDGSYQETMSRNGVPYCVTSETLGNTPMDRAVEVVRIWTKGLIDLAAK